MNDVNTGISAERVAYQEWVANQVAPYVADEEWKALLDQVKRAADDPDPNTLVRIFTTIPRMVKSVDRDLRITLSDTHAEGEFVPLVIKDWPLVRLIRIWTLMNIPPMEEAAYVALIERLFKYGEMEELAALYAALPVYYYPAAWVPRCTEGIRSNMAPVRQVVMINNPYPSLFLGEGAWNQLVLKAFFTDEDIPQIMGLKQRNNARLAEALIDYAYELHAAKRTINPMLWILAAPFVEARAYRLMEQIVQESQHQIERMAIAYALRTSNFGPAKDFIVGNTELMVLSETADTPWEGLLE